MVLPLGALEPRSGGDPLWLDLTLPTAAGNLALDEALLEDAEARSGGCSWLRLWELSEPAVVVGRSSRLAEEVDVEACERDGVPVLRRPSGGASIVAGPGCLMYCVVLSYDALPQLRMLEQAHRYVLDRVRRAVAEQVEGVTMEGTSDLAIGGRKFSGNSLRCKRQHLLYHGTILYDFRLELIPRYLKMPRRQPEYRQQREHGEFVRNAPLDPNRLRHAFRKQWRAERAAESWPRECWRQLLEQRYEQRAWHAGR